MIAVDYQSTKGAYVSLQTLTWVLRESETRGGARLVLIVLADHAWDDGTGAYPSVATIARKARMSERAVQYALRGLERDGHIRRTGTSPVGTVEYRLAMVEGGADFAPGGVQSTTARGADIAPEPSLEPSYRARSAKRGTSRRRGESRHVKDKLLGGD